MNMRPSHSCWAICWADLHTDGVIVTKQKNAPEYLVALRNAAEHPDTDADLGPASWTINPKAAVTHLRVGLDMIRSVEAKGQGRFEF